MGASRKAGNQGAINEGPPPSKPPIFYLVGSDPPRAGNIVAAAMVKNAKFFLKNHDVMNIDVNPHLLTATANATVPPVQGVHAMDQKTKPWAFPKPHPENTPRGERNKQEFDAPPEVKKAAPKPRAKKEPPAASRVRS